VVGRDEQASFTHVTAGTPADVWRRHPGWLAGDSASLDGIERLVVLAAHPDDESLGAGGLVATAARRGVRIDIVCATDGEGSHPDSPTHAPEVLALLRAEEGRRAAEALGVEGVTRLSLPDGDVAAHHVTLSDRVVEIVGDRPGAVVVAPWRRDGHPDHEAAGRAAATAARRTGAHLWEYPIWFWHWAKPAQAAWSRLARFDLDEPALRAKRAAIRAHASQIAPLSELEGDETLLPPELLAHFLDGPEHYVRTAFTAAGDETGSARIHGTSGG
jgi:LmbE family N-acetylglucosaminyl deacetylase